MIAGSPKRTTFNESDSADIAIDFVCLDSGAKSKEIPKTQCSGGLRAQAVFPSCWDGVNTDSDDHKSHMSYPEGTNPDSGDCPESHPNKVSKRYHETHRIP